MHVREREITNMLCLYAVPFGSNPPRRTFLCFFYRMETEPEPVSPRWEEGLRRLNEMCTLRKVEMLKEACEMLEGHAKQLAKMARDPHLVLGIFLVFVHLNFLGNGTVMGNWGFFLFAGIQHVEETTLETFLG